MHAYVLQVSKKKIDKDYEVDEEFFRENCDFVDRVASWVLECRAESNFKEALEWLENDSHSAAVIENADEKSFRIVNKDAYMSAAYKLFMERLNELNAYVTGETFAAPGFSDSMKLYWVDKTAHGTSDLYFVVTDEDDNNGKPVKMADFIRQTEDGEVWYIGALFDYHA